MKKPLIFVPSFVVLMLSCSNPTDQEPDNTLDFAEMEIHYLKFYPWGPTSKLDIHSDGLAMAYLIRDASNDVLDSATTMLSADKQNKLEILFASFLKYDSYYEPENGGVTDQDYHVTVLLYEGIPDTVGIYMPYVANLPDGLLEIIKEMESLWKSIIE